MSLKKMLMSQKGIGTSRLGRSTKSTIQELLKPETFKHTMKSLVDFSAPKSQVSDSNLAGREMLVTSQRVDLTNVPSLSEARYTELVNAESIYGRTLFGPIPEGHRREFFEYRKNVWVWHDSWLDEVGNTQGITIRYEVRPVGVYKKYAGGNYTRIEGEELNNFRKAARMYLELIKTNIYSK